MGAPLLTDEQRLAVVRELWAMAYLERVADGFRLLFAYERAIQRRDG